MLRDDGQCVEFYEEYVAKGGKSARQRNENRRLKDDLFETQLFLVEVLLGRYTPGTLTNLAPHTCLVVEAKRSGLILIDADEDGTICTQSLEESNPEVRAPLDGAATDKLRGDVVQVEGPTLRAWTYEGPTCEAGGLYRVRANSPDPNRHLVSRLTKNGTRRAANFELLLCVVPPDGKRIDSSRVVSALNSGAKVGLAEAQITAQSLATYVAALSVTPVLGAELIIGHRDRPYQPLEPAGKITGGIIPVSS